MRNFASKLHDRFSDLRLRGPTLGPPASTVSHSTTKSSDKKAPKNVIAEVSDGTNPKNLLVRQRLDVLSALRLYPRQLKLSAICQSGGKADVVHARFRRWYWVEGGMVAVKKLRCNKTKKACNEYVHEVEMMAGLSHENIIKLVGFVEDLENGIAWIVSSWEPNGNVREFLAKGNWEIPERVSLIRDTFEGIKYLHHQSPPICHGDLKSFNILVSASYRAIITDFGSSRRISGSEDEVIIDNHGQKRQGNITTEQPYDPIRVGAAGNQLTLTGPAWSLRWAPPEVVNGIRPGLSSDIWAAGWVCWEVMTGKVPFPELDSPGAITLTVIQGGVPSPVEHAQLAQIVALCNLMTDCWAFDPKDRLNASRCCDELKWMPSVRPSRGSPSGVKVRPINILIELSNMHRKQGDHAKGILLLQQALSLASSSGDSTAAATALDGLGGIYLLQSNYNRAEQSFTRAGEIYGITFNRAGGANTLYGLGHVYRAQSKFTQAEEAFTRARAIYTRIGSELGIANTLNGLGHVYRCQSRYAEAENSFIQAQEIHVDFGDDHGRANTLFGLGHVYRLQLKYTEAEALYTRAQEIYSRIGDEQGRANTLHGLGYTYRLQFRYALAEESYAQALAIYARIGNGHGRANTLRDIGDLRRDQGRDAEAATHYTEALGLYAQLGLAGDFEDVSRRQSGV